jgi:hypothetical protein
MISYSVALLSYNSRYCLSRKILTMRELSRVTNFRPDNDLCRIRRSGPQFPPVEDSGPSARGFYAFSPTA